MSGNALEDDEISQLLVLGDDEISGVAGFPLSGPKMLCFGDYQNPVHNQQQLKTISKQKKIKHAKGPKKHKLGDRIAALQQLVSPFGKTDTASVLHEAFGYIGFLQDQVHLLCSPYLQTCPSSSSDHADHPSNNDLRSRGLCLVPVDLTLHLPDDSNGPHFWSP